ncbi:TPA: hypothetical protein MW242_003029 [Acinetobacter baumannii]|nr:hypothetical protein [Acinetobacter baumannii]
MNRFSEQKENYRLTPEQLNMLGIWLFGPNYKNPLADFLNVDRRRINHWLDGDRPIPLDTTQKLVELANLRISESTKALKFLNNLLEK